MKNEFWESVYVVGSTYKVRIGIVVTDFGRETIQHLSSVYYRLS